MNLRKVLRLKKKTKKGIYQKESITVSINKTEKEIVTFLLFIA